MRTKSKSKEGEEKNTRLSWQAFGVSSTNTNVKKSKGRRWINASLIPDYSREVAPLAELCLKPKKLAHNQLADRVSVLG